MIFARNENQIAKPRKEHSGHLLLRLSALQAENRCMRENIATLLQENARLRESLADALSLETLS